MTSRHSQNSTDESMRSLPRHANLAIEYIEATNLDEFPDDVVLRRSLTTRSVISTTSSFAAQYHRAVTRPKLQCIQEIGQGLQGTIFEQVGQSLVMKKEKPGNDALPSNLVHEYTMHRSVAAAFSRYAPSVGCDIHIPKPSGITQQSDDAFWTENLHKFPAGHQTRTTLVHMERILPLPKVIRRALVKQFYPFQNHVVDLDMTNTILHAPENKHCLARTYLGCNDRPLRKDTFSLRNFPLYLDAMVRLDLETRTLALAMGQSYAIMHWGACVDADDVEFVLGSSAKPSREQQPDFQNRAVAFFLLDFGQCTAVDLAQDTAMVYQAFKGAMVTGDNQLFIPHYKKSPQLFAAFRKGYVEAGTRILEDKNLCDKFSMEHFMVEYEEYAEDFLL
ncbi:hypothetical protein DCS_08173 [Drechmeria coniospora]|uniref:DUF3669 domain-containing protein n=1 Tax=Drechmeria coniospora TaxID=98403 RepID=A0A151GGI8_DRECN|nr:hypothetical protein DCS_08173 [Drechmeria coniospora]KYK56205.1 hypothetical protein DCS_08173 [Drechmeria coniospora]